MEQIHKGSSEETQADHKVYLYHMVPKDMQGTVLHPLNRLKDSHPDLYLAKSEKYKDRQHLMEEFIPTLKAAWNDVLHFTAVNPVELKKAMVEAGMEPLEMKFYQVDPALLDPKRTTIYLYNDESRESKMSPENFAKFDGGRLGEYANLPEETKAYYKKMLDTGGKPLLFVGVPHILHKGSIDISDLPVITV